MKKSDGPLAGIRVIEMPGLGPAPFCGMMLADLGADVIRLDRLGSRPTVAMDQRFDILSRGRRSILLDVKHPRGVDVALQLIDSADVLIEGMRPGAMERLGLGPDECRARNPKLIYARMTGWGQDGPMAQRAGHDINYISLNGVLHSIGLMDGPPVPPINLVGDYGGGAMFLITGILAALIETGRSGTGQVIDAAMLEGASYLMTTIHMFANAGMWQPKRGSNLLDSGAPFYSVYETGDGKYMAVGAIEPKFYQELVDGLGLNIEQLPPATDVKQWPELRKIFAKAFAGKTREEWASIFEHRDACTTPVLSMDESLRHEHNRQRGNFVEVDGAVQPNIAPRFSKTEVTVDAAITRVGRHSVALLEEIGLSGDDVTELLDRGVVGLEQAADQPVNEGRVDKHDSRE